MLGQHLIVYSPPATTPGQLLSEEVSNLTEEGNGLTPKAADSKTTSIN
jgi:hypothetical protein